MADCAIDLGDGVTLSPSTPEDFDFVNAHLREGDKAECDALKTKERIENFDRVWTVRDNGEIVAFLGYLAFPDDGPNAPRRFLAGLTTTAVWSRKKKFVRRSPDVVNAVLCTLPPFVTEIYSAPMKSYRGAVRWLDRILGFKPLYDYKINNVDHTFMLRRKTSWLQQRL